MWFSDVIQIQQIYSQVIFHFLIILIRLVGTVDYEYYPWMEEVSGVLYLSRF